MSEVICAECGNDLACEGLAYCSECLERPPCVVCGVWHDRPSHQPVWHRPSPAKLE